MKQNVFLLCVILNITITGCQIFKINKSDKHGNRQGHWEHYWNDEGTILLSGNGIITHANHLTTNTA